MHGIVLKYSVLADEKRVNIKTYKRVIIKLYIFVQRFNFESLKQALKSVFWPMTKELKHNRKEIKNKESKQNTITKTYKT